MKQKMKFFAALLACAMTISPIAAMAGQWVPMGSDWAYMTDDGDFAKNCWLCVKRRFAIRTGDGLKSPEIRMAATPLQPRDARTPAGTTLCRCLA